MLARIFHELNTLHFDADLPEPRLVWNSRLSTSAGRFVPSLPYPFHTYPSRIEVASYLRDLEDGERHIRDTLLHEMIHYLLWLQGKPHGHTPEFLAIMERVGTTRWNPVPRDRPIKHWYECPGCLERFPTRRKLQPGACVACCRKWNKGKFSEKFLLRLVDGPKATIPQEPPEIPLSKEETWGRLEKLKRLLTDPV
ncbi:MAG: SprT-like domain-containing protein [Bdellovibrionales bacterium]|nr:SprT-like domain-containing protein [Bdellovibrionales bacterium]